MQRNRRQSVGIHAGTASIVMTVPAAGAVVKLMPHLPKSNSAELPATMYLGSKSTLLLLLSS